MPAVHCVVFVDKILTLPLRMLSSVIVLVLRTDVQCLDVIFFIRAPTFLVVISVKMKSRQVDVVSV